MALFVECIVWMGEIGVVDIEDIKGVFETRR